MDGPARHERSTNGRVASDDASMDGPDAGQGHPDLSRPRRLLILVICSMSLLIVGLDVTIVNVALPAIHRSLGASVSGLQWVIDAYTLTIASLLMLAGSTADRIGRRKVFLIGLVVFSTGSLLCALAPTLNLLIAARVLQGMGGSMLNPVAMSIIRNVFDDPRERAQAIGVWGGMIGLSMALGPIVGGALVDTLGWQWVFLVNIPVGLLAITLTTLFVPESRAPRPRRLDPVGQALVIVALASLTYAIIEGGRVGFTSAGVIGLFCLSLVSFVFLVFYELHHSEPLLEMRFFKSVPFSGASAIAVCAFAGQGGFLFLNTLYLQDVRGLSPFDAGLYVLPMAAMTLVFAPLTGRFIGRHGTRIPLVVAGTALTVAAVMLTQITAGSSPAYVLGAYFVFGIGFGIVNPPITNTAVSGMPPSQAGVAAAVASTSRQVGATLGVAVLGAVAGAGVSGEIGKSFVVATHASWWIVAGLSFAIVVLGLATTTRWAHQTAVEAANRFREDGPQSEGPARDEPVPARRETSQPTPA
jgi:EmrB/QacA subfamily drug resistance transporter